LPRVHGGLSAESARRQPMHRPYDSSTVNRAELRAGAVLVDDLPSDHFRVSGREDRFPAHGTHGGRFGLHGQSILVEVFWLELRLHVSVETPSMNREAVKRRHGVAHRDATGA
jgi:hypothetical protein